MSQPVIYQRVEAFTGLIATLYFYTQLHFSLIAFFVLLFIFDISMLGYVFNQKIGAHGYNIGHNFIGPSAALVTGAAFSNRALTGLALIWFAHICLDRALGYGLKYDSGFADTHLGHIGKANHRGKS